MEFDLPKGLIGFEDQPRFELLVNTEELPFMWIRSASRQELGFIVIEPSQILEDYDIELSDEDVKFLEIEKAEDALVLNIVTIKDGQSIDEATVNLIGPIVISRNTLKGKQVIVSNYSKFSARHPVLKDSING